MRDFLCILSGDVLFPLCDQQRSQGGGQHCGHGGQEESGLTGFGNHIRIGCAHIEGEGGIAAVVVGVLEAQVKPFSCLSDTRLTATSC